jgi:hypothetical protein
MSNELVWFFLINQVFSLLLKFQSYIPIHSKVKLFQKIGT